MGVKRNNIINDDWTKMQSKSKIMPKQQGQYPANFTEQAYYVAQL